MLCLEGLNGTMNIIIQTNLLCAQIHANAIHVAEWVEKCNLLYYILNFLYNWTYLSYVEKNPYHFDPLIEGCQWTHTKATFNYLTTVVEQ